MNIYKRANYRKIYEDHFGPIPKDELGRSYQIHHMDGNRNNNSIENLQCVSIQEHYDIHYSQGDYRACQLLAVRLNKTGEEIAELARKAANDLLSKNKHNFQLQKIPFPNVKMVQVLH